MCVCGDGVHRVCWHTMYTVPHREIQAVARNTLFAVVVCFTALVGLEKRTELGLVGIWIAVRLLGTGRLVGGVMRLRARDGPLRMQQEVTV